MLKVGQEVTIRKDLEVGESYGGEVFTQDMERYLGKGSKIIRIFDEPTTTFKLNIDDRFWTWTKEMFEPIQDNVNHPSHYQNGGKEAIEIIKDTTGDKFNGFLVGNVIKYLTRFEFKNGVEDLKKAQFYLDRLIKEVEGE